MKPKNPNIDPNSWLLPETAARFEVVDWNFGHMIHMPTMRHLGHPNGRVNLKDLKPDYAEKLVEAGFRHLKKKPGILAEDIFKPRGPREPEPETPETPAETTTETPETAPKRGKK